MITVLIALVFTLLPLVACLIKIADDIHSMRGEYLKLNEAENDNNKDIMRLNRKLLSELDDLSNIQKKFIDIMTIDEEGDTVSETTETTNS